MTVELRAEPTPAGHPALDLRPWDDSDIRPLIDVYRDPVLRRWTRLPVTGVEDALRWLEVQRDGWRSGERFSFAVIEEGRLVGNVALKRGADHRAEVGYWTAAGARGRGIAPRALEALTGWAFGALPGGHPPRTAPPGRQHGLLPRRGEDGLRLPPHPPRPPAVPAGRA